MKNFKINMNREQLSEEDIARGKNFDAVLKGAVKKRKPISRSIKYWLFSASSLAAAVAVLIIYLRINSAAGPQPFINPPLANVNVAYESYSVNTETDSVITTKTGSKIHIPANAFLDKNGKVLHEKVELKYREFHQLSEVFVAGIPMAYDSAGTTYNFETAGMMEICASCNGEAAQTNPNALINVNMVSFDTSDRFNTYYLDTAAKKWNYVAQVNFASPLSKPLFGDSTDVSSRIQASANTIKPTAPSKEKSMVMNVVKEKPAGSLISSEPGVKRVRGATDASRPLLGQSKRGDSSVFLSQTNQPYFAAVSRPAGSKPVVDERPISLKKSVPDRPKFTIRVDSTEFPELVKYNGLKFQVVYIAEFKPEKAAVTWDNVQLKRAENGNGRYQVTFIKGNERYSIIAEPVVDEKDFAAAQKIYDENYKNYLRKLAEKEALAEKRRLEDSARIAALPEEQKQQEIVYRSFKIMNFGYWNGDHPWGLSMPCADINAQFVNAKDGQPIALRSANLAVTTRKMIYTNFLFVKSALRMHFDADQENVLWAITADGKIAVIKSSDFKKQIGDGIGEKKLAVEIVEKKFETEAEVKEYLGI